MDDMELIVAELAHARRTRHYGKYRGLVRDVGDPDGLGRIQAEVPAVYGDALSPWALPAVPFAGPSHGFVMLPEPGDGVWIEFEGGDPSRPIWSGFWWGNGQRPSPRGDLVRLVATRSGHKVVLDEDGDVVQLVHPGGAEVTLGASEITLKLGNAQIRITSTEVVVNGGMLTVTASGVKLVNDAVQFGP